MSDRIPPEGTGQLMVKLMRAHIKAMTDIIVDAAKDWGQGDEQDIQSHLAASYSVAVSIFTRAIEHAVPGTINDELMAMVLLAIKRGIHQAHQGIGLVNDNQEESQ